MNEQMIELLLEKILAELQIMNARSEQAMAENLKRSESADQMMKGVMGNLDLSKILGGQHGN